MINGNGAPTRKTHGAIGDIYIDNETGAKYECIFSYRDISGTEFDCQWEKIEDGEPVVEPKTEESEKEPAIVPQVTVVEPESEKGVKEPEKEEPKEPEKGNKQIQRPTHQNNNPNRTNYHQQYNKR